MVKLVKECYLEENMRFYAVMLALFLFVTTVFAQSDDFIEKTHPIDIAVNQLMEADESTHGQIQALAKGYELWDAELNKAYQELMKAYGTNDKLKATLKEAQLAWINYRDASFKHFEAVCESKEGSMYRVFLASDRMEFVRSRTHELRVMYGSFTETN